MAALSAALATVEHVRVSPDPPCYSPFCVLDLGLRLWAHVGTRPIDAPGAANMTRRVGAARCRPAVIAPTPGSACPTGLRTPPYDATAGSQPLPMPSVGASAAIQRDLARILAAALVQQFIADAATTVESGACDVAEPPVAVTTLELSDARRTAGQLRVSRPDRQTGPVRTRRAVRRCVARAVPQGSGGVRSR